MHYELPDVNELGGELSDDMYSQKRFVGHPEHELHETVREPRDPGFRVRREGGAAYLMGDSGCACLLLRETDPGYLGIEKT
jgi:hypothetical protein